MTPPPPKKLKTDGPAAAAPPYQSQQYWDDRYAGKLSDSPCHCWYFSYKELRPLLLPLIFGTQDPDNVTPVDDKASNDALLTGDADKVPATANDKDTTATQEEAGSKQKAKSSTAANGTHPENHSPTESATIEGGDDNDTTEDQSVADNDSVEWEEDDSDEEDEPLERVGLAERGPIRVLEVGCGDRPLATELGLELQGLEEATSSKWSTVVSEIVCTDYSRIVVDQMKSKIKPDIATFDTQDARALTYDDQSFDLIVEKGTLDAMLSDKAVGSDHCRKIVAECGRVLKAPGYFVLISHLNAHTINGQSWLEQVVFKGLLNTGDYLIECHGNAEIIDEDDDSANGPIGSAGPAVYIIEKMSNVSTQATIPVKLLAY